MVLVRIQARILRGCNLFLGAIKGEGELVEIHAAFSRYISLNGWKGISARGEQREVMEGKD